MKSRLDQLYEEKENIENEIKRLKTIQSKCEHIFTPLIYEPYYINEYKVDRWYRRCVTCEKVEYALSCDDPHFYDEDAYVRKL